MGWPSTDPISMRGRARGPSEVVEGSLVVVRRGLDGEGRRSLKWTGRPAVGCSGKKCISFFSLIEMEDECIITLVGYCAVILGICFYVAAVCGNFGKLRFLI